jgi:hypothetical protein
MAHNPRVLAHVASRLRNAADRAATGDARSLDDALYIVGLTFGDEVTIARAAIKAVLGEHDGQGLTADEIAITLQEAADAV